VSRKPHPVETALSEMAAAGKPCPRCGSRPGVVPVHGIPGSLTYWCAECAAPPQWTTTPPTEPGWYWWRDSDTFDVGWGHDTTCVVQIYTVKCGEYVELRYRTHGLNRLLPQKSKCQWWPVRIEEPPR
jgi:hypothetical protein